MLAIERVSGSNRIASTVSDASHGSTVSTDQHVIEPIGVEASTINIDSCYAILSKSGTNIKASIGYAKTHSIKRLHRCRCRRRDTLH